MQSILICLSLCVSMIALAGETVRTPACVFVICPVGIEIGMSLKEFQMKRPKAVFSHVEVTNAYRRTAVERREQSVFRDSVYQFQNDQLVMVTCTTRAKVTNSTELRKEFNLFFSNCSTGRVQMFIGKSIFNGHVWSGVTNGVRCILADGGTGGMCIIGEDTLVSVESMFPNDQNVKKRKSELEKMY